MKILIIDDHPLFSDGLRLLISDIREDVEVECLQSLQATDALVPDYKPDLILLDYYLKDRTSINAIQSLKELFDGASVVVISSEESAYIIQRALKDGADGYIPKSSEPKVLISALQLVLAGGTYIPKETHSHYKDAAGKIEAKLNLTARQKEVLALAIQGKANKVIASELEVAEGTVKAHLSAAFQVLGVKNRTEATISARNLNIFDLCE